MVLSPRSSILRPFLAEERTVVLCEACGKSWSSTEKGLQGELEFFRVGIMAAGDMAVLESRLTTKIICINTRITYCNLNHRSPTWHARLSPLRMAEHSIQESHKLLGRLSQRQMALCALSAPQRRLVFSKAQGPETQAQVRQVLAIQVCTPGHKYIVNSVECEARIAESRQELRHEARQALTPI